jgi:hypothetical protein
MTGRQEYDRTKDRQRILDEYMIDGVLNQDSIASRFGYSIIKRPRLNADGVLKTRIQVARQEIK